MRRARFSVLTFQINGWRELSTKTRGFWWCSIDWMGFRCKSTWQEQKKKGKKEREKLAPCYHKYIEEVGRVKNTNPTRSVRVHNMI